MFHHFSHTAVTKKTEINDDKNVPATAAAASAEFAPAGGTTLADTSAGDTSTAGTSLT